MIYLELFFYPDFCDIQDHCLFCLDSFNICRKMRSPPISKYDSFSWPKRPLRIYLRLSSILDTFTQWVPYSSKQRKPATYEDAVYVTRSYRAKLIFVRVYPSYLYFRGTTSGQSTGQVPSSTVTTEEVVRELRTQVFIIYYLIQVHFLTLIFRWKLCSLPSASSSVLYNKSGQKLHASKRSVTLWHIIAQFRRFD